MMDKIIMQDRDGNAQRERLNNSNSVYKPTTLPTLPRKKNRRFQIFNRNRSSHDDDRRLANSEQIAQLLFGEIREAECESYINRDQEDEMQIVGYRRSYLRTFICWFFIALTCGLLRLIMHWRQHWLLLGTHAPCALDNATKVLVTESFQGKHSVFYVKDIITLNANMIQKIIKDKKKMEKYKNFVPVEVDKHNANQPIMLSVQFADGVFRHLESIRVFQCKKLRYIWNEATQSFVKLMGLDHQIPTVVLHQSTGLSKEEQYYRRLIYGPNRISIPLKTIATLLFLEVLNPFYCFQVFSVALWFSYNYYYYATVIILMSGFGITASVIQTRRNQQALYSTIMNSDTAVVIREDGSSDTIETQFLVPGDVLEIPSSGCTMQCDAVLLSGNCILDESMLTGESVPVTKTPMPCKRDLLLDTREHARHVLFSGTKVIQTRYIGSEKVLAVVVNTGNKTAKGGLIRSILYPPPVDYKFEQDSYKFIMLLGLAAGSGFIYTLISKIIRGVSGLKIAIEALDLITIAVPPALPAAMTVGRMYAQKRLKNNNIYCISPRSINVSGSIDCVCFDKTGTLTEDGLDMWGVVPKSATNHFQIPFRDVSRLPYDHLLYGMVTCHSLTIMGGELKGDPLDLKMFDSSGWVLEEANVADDNKYDMLFPTIVRPPIVGENNGSSDGLNTVQLGIVREFSFTSSLQRMSVITRSVSDDHFNVYCKGSPEMLLTLCSPESIPKDFHSTLDVYAQQGYRIIAIAHKSLEKKLTYAKIQRVSREKIECDLNFQGFVILENRLKADTTSVIESLMAANIRTIMVTGDNILTAVSVAKDCGMITTGQSVITVDYRQNSKDGEYELLYNLTGQPGRGDGKPKFSMEGKQNGDAIDAGRVNATGNGEYILMTNSNSVASLETIDTFTHTTNTVSERADIEMGGYTRKRRGFMKDYDAPRLAAELPTNKYRFAMTGRTWAVINSHFPEMLPKFCTRGAVFARMAPEQKQALVQALQGLGYYVAMCGDGANDCGALKAAHTGISLSEAESSVASPFTSKNPTISCVPNIIKEGRAALVTLFGIFKYMAAYSLVQFASVLILYSIDSNLTDFEFLYIDLFLISIFAFFFGKTESYNGPLVKQPPLSSLVSLSPVMSLVLQLIVVIALQVIGWFHVQMYDWFEPFDFSNDKEIDDLGCHQNFTIFIISCFQYITLAFVFSKGAPYRKSILSNYGFIISIILSTLFSLFLAIYPADWVINLFNLVVPPDIYFRLSLCIYGVVNFVLALFIEMFIIDYILFKKLRYRFHDVNKSRRKYLAIENDLRQNTSWPPLTSYQPDNHFVITDKSTPSSYAEMGVEHSVGTLVDPNSLVLNSFFTDKPNEENDEHNQISSKDSGVGFDSSTTNNYNHHHNYHHHHHNHNNQDEGNSSSIKSVVAPAPAPPTVTPPPLTPTLDANTNDKRS